MNRKTEVIENKEVWRKKMRLSQNKLEMASVVLFQVEVFWIFL